MQAARLGSSGYSDDAEWNRNLKLVQTDLFNTMAPLYSKNIQVQDMLAPFVKSLSDQVVTNGAVVKDANYGQLISINIGGYPVYPININEESIINTSPVRKPSIEKNQYYYLLKNNQINILPYNVQKVSYEYLRVPADALIKFNIVETSESDYFTPEALSEIEWPVKASNFLLYLMLEKYGIDQRESLAIEYSQIGIQKEISKV